MNIFIEVFALPMNIVNQRPISYRFASYLPNIANYPTLRYKCLSKWVCHFYHNNDSSHLVPMAVEVTT